MKAIPFITGSGIIAQGITITVKTDGSSYNTLKNLKIFYQQLWVKMLINV